ncbi:Homeobox domain-like [Trinorchestia longiramus]|nr:Homeobox domain-like [Trinorchestia longiramus]
MGKDKDISQDLRERIVELHYEGLGYRKINAQLCVPIASVETIISKWKCRNTTLSKPRTGRPRKINDRAAQKLVRTIVQRPQTTREELKDDLKAFGVEASKHTISRNGRQSPDMNPVENLWRELKLKIQKRGPNNITELKEICIEEWNKITSETCKKLLVNYYKRFDAIINNKGYAMKY